MRDLTDDAALVALLRERPGKMSWSDVTEAVLDAGSAHVVWEAAMGGALFGSEGAANALEDARADLEKWRASGIRFLSVLDPDFPPRVRSIREVPPFLTARGTLGPQEMAVSVVGSRKASDHGLRMARGIATALAQEGITTLAGLAEGIDAAAHVAALRASGRTVAIIGTGVNREYPAKNRDLQRQLAVDGLVLSQFWPDAPPQRHNFLMRNAVMSGYGRATVVVEAGERSGARAQARMAVEHGRPVVLTDHVVERNAWARELMGRPRVFVAASAADVLHAISLIGTRETATADAVAQLVPDFA